MKYNKKIYAYIVFCALSINAPLLQAAVVLKGDDAAATGTSFSFPIFAHAASVNNDMFVVAASGGAPKDFAIAATIQGNSFFKPFAPENTKLNNVEGQPNPLYNANFSYLTFLSGVEGQGLGSFRTDWPAMIKSNELSNVYVLDFFFASSPQVLSALNIKDASGSAVTAGIVGLGNIGNTYVAAPVLGNGQVAFGAGNSGVAFMFVNSNKKEEGGQKTQERNLVQVDAPTTPAPTNPTDTRALPLNYSSTAVIINSPLTAISNQIKFFWDEKLKVMYGALQITGGAGATDGGIAVFKVIAIENNKLLLLPVAPTTAFSNTDVDIIGGVGSSIQVSINNVKTMYTSTRLNYLIVQGGIGAPSATTNIVYALPLVNNPNPLAMQGAVANKLENPPTMSTKFGFQTPAVTPDQMTNINDVAAQVGGGALPNGDIVDMFVKNDCVYVSVLEAEVNENPGLFYSQAIMDTTTKIVAWTEWRRVNGSIDPVFGAAYDSLGNFTYMTGNALNTIQTVKRTVWGTDGGDGLLGGETNDSSNGFIAVFDQQFPRQNGSIQGFFDFPSNTPTFNGISLFVATGNNTVALATSGDSSTGFYTSNFGDYASDIFVFTNGAITQNLPNGLEPRVVAISGGELANIGAITKAEIGTITNNGRLFVGGTKGLAALVDSTTGNGWSSLATYFVGLTNGMVFKKIGNYSFVRKLISDSGFLYVMTDKKLDRINLTLSNFATGALSVSTLASNSGSIPGIGNNETFTDFIASGKFGVIATSKGIYRVGDGKNLTTASSINDLNWTKVQLPETLVPVTQFVPITKTGRAQDLAVDGVNNLYVLNAYIGKNLAQIYRFVIQDVSVSEINANTMQLFPDFFLAGIPAPLYDFNNFRDLLYTDGAALLHAKDKNLIQNPFLQILFGLQTGVSGLTSQPVPLTLMNATIFQKLIRSSASGAFVIAGDFGIQVSE